MYTTQVLANYVSDQRAGCLLTTDVVDVTLRCVMDLLGAAIAGAFTPSVVGTRQVAREIYGAGMSPIWFSGDKSSAVGASLANSTASSVLDLDDGNRAGGIGSTGGHPGAAVIPSVFATAAEVGATFEEFLAAIVIGYEVGLRISSGTLFDVTSGCGTGQWCGFSAVASAARLRKTPPTLSSHALAISGVTSPNLRAAGTTGYSRLPGSDVKEATPWATVTGLTSLAMAEKGLVGSEDIFDVPPHFDASVIVDGLGTRTPLITGTYFKPYSSCRYIHPAIQAFDTLIKNYNISASEIISVEIHTFQYALSLGNLTAPVTLSDVQYSVPYCIALTAVLGSDALLPLTPDALNRPEVIEFSKKVSLHLDPEFDQRFPRLDCARAVVVTTSGRHESPVTTPRGDPTNPMSWHDVEDKFLRATRHTLTQSQQSAFVDAIGRLRQGELGPLTHFIEQPLGNRP